MTTRSKTIHRLLSLVLCLCMVLTLLPMIPMEAEAASPYLYLQPNSNWKVDNARFAAYFFGNGEKWVSGTKLANGKYQFKVPTDKQYPKVIFCRMNPSNTTNNWNNKWNQTGDLTIPTNGNNLFTVPDNVWDGSTSGWGKYDYCGEYGHTTNKDNTCQWCGVTFTTCQLNGHNYVGDKCSVCQAGLMTIYFRNDWFWSDVSVYYWLGASGAAAYNNAWPGAEMELFGNDGKFDYYVTKIPTDVMGFIINGIKNGTTSTLDQTPDITSGIKDGVGYYMFYSTKNEVKTFDISTVKFPCKHKNVVDVAGTDATCTATGLTAGTKCADCGEPIQAQDVIPALGHTWSNATCDAPKTCSVCGATEGEALGHSYVRECDTNCSVCGEKTRPDAVHVSNAYACCEGICVYGCGTVMPASAAHTYQNACDADCDVCGEPREVGEHVYDNGCDVDCNICGDIREVGEHQYYYDCDTNCFICGQETRPEAVHVSNYSYPCRDGVCMYGCGTEMPATAEHTYDNACDATCNVCGQGRLPAEHQYECIFMQNPTCGQEGIERYRCTVCGDTYEKASAPTGEHTYDNECDATCNVCDEPREVAGHYWIDATCTDPMYCAYCYVTEGEPAGHGHTEGFVYHMDTDYHEVWCADCWDYSYQENHTIGEDHYCICGQEELMTVTFLVDGQIWTVFDRYYNTPVAFAGMNFPTKEGYSFTGWYTADGEKIENRTMVLENMIVHAGFQIKTFSVTWNVAGVETEETYEYGMIPEFTGSTDKAQEGCDVYTFIGWDQPIVAVTGDVTYTAVYTSAKSHTAEVVPGYAADCTNTGLTDGSKCAVCGETLIAQEIIPATGIHADADKNYRCDSCNKLMQDAQLAKVSVSLKGNIAVNYYMLLTDEVLADSTAYMQFTMADGEIIQIPVADGVKMVLEGETYYVYTCAVSAKEMTDDILSQFFYAGGETKLHTYKIQTYAKHILANYDDAATKNLIAAMVNYGAASQVHFGYNTDDLANTGVTEAPDYSDVTIAGFNAVAGQGTDLAKFYSASLILKSETTVRFFFQVDSAASFTASYNGQELTVGKRSGLYYVDVVGISAKDLDEDVTITINDGTNSTEVSFNPMSYCQGVLNDTTGAFSNEMKDLVRALYLYNQAANVYFKEV